MLLASTLLVSLLLSLVLAAAVVAFTGDLVSYLRRPSKGFPTWRALRRDLGVAMSAARHVRKK
ncbi:MAG: hypothetical protein JWR27_1450 [Aeromicrobium sp.]|jgi:hypothetical protein|nr:hypothetical protein [Aeromicrobium sp.]